MANQIRLTVTLLYSFLGQLHPLYVPITFIPCSLSVVFPLIEISGHVHYEWV